jgi:iron complex outermembrane receptor protein
MSRLSRCGCALACALCCTTPALAQTVEIPEIEVSAPAAPLDLTPPPVKQRYQLPNSSASTTAARIETTTNSVDAADTIKYLPSILVRKRNYGDNQQVLATRYWGINGSARSLVYADDILLSALINNNNSNATPRWGLVAPEQIARVDMLYGPFAAMYPGNSMGGVLLFTTKMPDKPVATVRQSESFQTFNFYNTKDTYRTDNTSASFGNRVDNFSFFVGANYQNSYSQPLTWVTTTGVPTGTSGTILQPNRTNTGQANVVGAGGLLHTEQTNLNLKAALDITPWLRLTYGLGLWSNNQDSTVQTYLRDAAGNPTYGNTGAFANNYYNLKQTDLADSLSLKTDTGGAFDWDVAVSRFDYLQDIQRNPFTVTTTGTGFTNTGKIARMDGTNWTTADAKGIWRTSSPVGPHEISFGAHLDYYVLDNPTYQTPTWYGGPDSTNTLYSRGDGKTETLALWAQDAWRFAPQFKLTTGVRWETWRAFDGYNFIGNTATNSTTGAIISTSTLIPPNRSEQRASPKASLSWEPNKDWTVTGSFGVANRFPTVGELYQVVTAGPILANPNPNLQPETAYDEEIAIERKFSDGLVRLSLFNDDTYDALISQTTSGAGTSTAFVTNVDHIRNRGVEFAWQKSNLPVEKVEMFGSVTYVDSVIVSDPNFVGTNGSTATGKQVPYVPKWRATFGATWRPTDALALTVVGRYQSKIYATLDNTDYVQNVYQAFDPFFVVDARVVYTVSKNGSISFGVDNLNNDKYHLFHPFPERTYVVQGRLTF